MPYDNKLFVGNLPSSFDKGDFRKLFSHFGDIGSLKVFDKFAFVTFKDAKHADEAKKRLNKKIIGKQSIHIDFARSANDLIIKPQKHKPQTHKPPKHKRKFESLSKPTTSTNEPKRRKVAHNNKQIKTVRIPPMRIVKITNIPENVSMNELEQAMSNKYINKNGYQYLIYPSNDGRQNGMNNAWILHKTIPNAQNTIFKLDKLILNDSMIRVSFARKLGKLNRVKIMDLPDCNANKAQIKTFINNYFNTIFKFDDEENKKLAKYNRFAGKARKYHTKPSNKKYDVIQNIFTASPRQQCIVIEFKKADYALFAVQHMNGIEFASKTIYFRFDLEKYPTPFFNNESSESTPISTVQPTKSTPQIQQPIIASPIPQTQAVTVAKTQSIQPAITEKKAAKTRHDPNKFNKNMVKMFNIDKSVKYEQLKELILSIIDLNYYDHVIYPAPDSLPHSQTAWICLKNNKNANVGRSIIKKLNGKEINSKSVGVIFVKTYLTPQKIMVRNLPDSIKKNDIMQKFSVYGEITDISMKGKENNCKIEHCGWCFITFSSVISAVNAMKELNGSKLNNKIIAIDYSLPNDIYTKIQKHWKTYNIKQGIIADPIKKKEKVPSWKLYTFMRDDYEKRSFFVKYMLKKQRDKAEKFEERVYIPISSEPLDYDWLKYFLWRHRLNIIQYECNCKLEINVNVNNNYIDILSDNQISLGKCTKIVNEILHNKVIREVGYTQIMNIPFDAEPKDFDWKLYFNGDGFEKRKKFEFETGCSFHFKGKGLKMQIEFAGATHQTLQRGVHFIKNKHCLDRFNRDNREKEMGYKHIARIYDQNCAKNRDIKQIEKSTNCRIRVFGSLLFQFANRKKTKTYFKIMAQNEADLKEGCKLIREWLRKERENKKNKPEAETERNKRFWFYSGDANEGRTIFVRNMPYDIGEEAIRNKFAQFGTIISIKIVYDKITGNAKGSAFIQYDNCDDVDNILDNETNILLNGRKLIVNIAVNKKAARKIEKKSIQNKDKRNLYLAKEGIMLSAAEMDGMEKSELKRRITQWKAKKIKLQDPNFHISLTRLSIRNIPAFVNEKYLRKVFLEKAMEIRKQIEESKEKTDVFEHKFVKINQVKIVRDMNRVNGKGIGRSKKFGFVEFREHSDSLLMLRALNNKLCSEIFDLKSTTKSEKEKMGALTIEFSVENMQKLNIHFAKTKLHQKRCRNINLENLKGKLAILKAQKQEPEIKNVEGKINQIQKNIKLEMLAKKKEHKLRLRTKIMKRNQFGHKVTKKFKHQRSKKKSRGIKHA